MFVVFNHIFYFIIYLTPDINDKQLKREFVFKSFEIKYEQNCSIDCYKFTSNL